MKGFTLTNKARDDLLAIARYTQSRWGISQRNTYLQQLDSAFHKIARSPSIGVQCDDIREAYRKLPHASHVIFYRLVDKELIQIVRILHNSMDVELNMHD